MKFQNESEIALWQQALLIALQFGNEASSGATKEADAIVEAFRERMAHMMFVPAEEPQADEPFHCPGYYSPGIGNRAPCERCNLPHRDH